MASSASKLVPRAFAGQRPENQADVPRLVAGLLPSEPCSLPWLSWWHSGADDEPSLKKLRGRLIELVVECVEQVAIAILRVAREFFLVPRNLF